MISMIVAHDLQKVIGINNDMPWHLPEELGYFKKMTMGKAMIMGRKTFESIGRPLPGRQSIVVTRNPDFTYEGVIVKHSLEEAIEAAKAINDETMIIGGAEIFKLGLAIADRLYITEIQQDYEGDTYFPSYEQDWVVVSKSELQRSADGTTYYYLVYERK